jgi:hypothetical protein
LIKLLLKLPQNSMVKMMSNDFWAFLTVSAIESKALACKLCQLCFFSL